MKICWDNLEGAHLTKNGTFVKGTSTYIYKESCINCGESYLTRKSTQSKFCTFSCANKGRKLSDEWKKKISVAHMGKTLPVETRKKLSIAHTGKTVSVETRKKLSVASTGRVYTIETRKKMSGISNPSYRGGVTVKGLTTYDTHKDTLSLYEDIRKQEGTEVLEVKCTYCGQWFAPTRIAVNSRLMAINNLNRGEGRFYCSENCKQACPTYGQKKYPKGFKHTTSREVSTYLRQIVLKRDNWTCQICGRTSKEAQLHVHHMDPASQNPMFQNDIDSCVTLCKKCHAMVHSRRGCRYVDLRCKEKVSDQFTVKGYGVS